LIPQLKASLISLYLSTADTF